MMIDDFDDVDDEVEVLRVVVVVVAGLVIKLTILGGSNVCKCMVILMDFPNNSTLFGLVI